MKKVILATTNDLSTDQRVHRTAITLLSMGASVLMVGRVKGNALPLIDRPYRTKRFHLLFRKGIFFYATYNLRLLIYLLFHHADIIVSVDLDTLLACTVAAWIKNAELVYDCHEYFTEVPELVDRHRVKAFWARLERSLLPGIKHSYTVNSSLADIYNLKYNQNMQVIRNLPLKKDKVYFVPEVLNFPGRKILLYQGSLNMGRGIELAIEAMQWVDSAVLAIIGSGDIEHDLKKLTERLNLADKVYFIGRVPMENLHNFTSCAYLGLSLEEKLGLNYFYALPNKIFDYIQAHVPILVSDLPEMSAIVQRYQVGAIVKSRTPRELAKQISEILTDENTYRLWRSNLMQVSSMLVWENEASRLRSIFIKAGLTN